MHVTVLLYPGVTALDAIGPYEVLSRPPGWSVTFAALDPGEVRTDTGALGLVVDRRLAEVERTDLLVIPGAPLRRVPADEPTLAEVRRLHATTRITASVCTGAFVLARAGLLAGKRATTHWARVDALRELGVDVVSERVVRDGKVATAAGVSEPGSIWRSRWSASSRRTRSRGWCSSGSSTTRRRRTGAATRRSRRRRSWPPTAPSRGDGPAGAR